MKKFVLLVFLLTALIKTYSKEGMWVPIFLEGAVMDDMKLNGLKLTSEDIYSVNKSSLKDAVVHFGGGCTGEIISDKGLLLTNHHCGYSRIQSHSSLENDYLTDGFWARSMEEELTNPGLTATFIIEIKEVTEQVLQGVDQSQSSQKRDSIKKSNIDKLIEELTSESHYEGFVRSFYYGNQYILFITEVFKDVRLVGAPPSSIGKYGFDTDNWVWPRHTGDFSLFRIYADKENKPAEYNEENVPFKPRYHFPISLNGYKEGDFTMVYGFPGRTSEYLTASAVDHIMNVSNPTKIEIRTKKLEVLNQKMSENDAVRIKYAAKQSSTSNAWKKWMGQNKGLKRKKAIQLKKDFEREFQFKVELYPDSFGAYTNLLNDLEKAHAALNEVSLAREYYIEIAYFGTDALKLAYRLSSYVNKAENDELKEEDIKKLKSLIKGHYKDFDQSTDKTVFQAIIPLYFKAEDNFYKPQVVKDIETKYGDKLVDWSDDIYENSLLSNEAKANAEIEKDASKFLLKLKKDDLYTLGAELRQFYISQISPAYSALKGELDIHQKKYMVAIQDVFPEKRYYPDANGTLRLTFGRVEGMSPSDAVTYMPYTTLDGVIAKYDPSSMEYDLPVKLLELHRSKDYGQYAQDGELRVCFIASNHTSGGNSGSPVINSKGQLIGLNFDRNWEGTMSDIVYDVNQCRNISVDIRYVLFIVDKFAGVERLIDEMQLVKSDQSN